MKISKKLMLQTIGKKTSEVQEAIKITESGDGSWLGLREYLKQIQKDVDGMISVIDDVIEGKCDARP